jgi:hypothetical protein
MIFFDWTLSSIRLKQFGREIKLIGIFRSIVISIVLILAAFRVVENYYNFNLALITLASSAALILSVHITRKDKAFVFLHLPNPRKAILTEYIILSFILVGYLVVSPYWYFFLLLLIICSVISGIRYEVKKKTNFGFLSKLISPKNFEWIGGIRKYKYTFVLLYTVTLAVSPVIFLPVFFLWVLTIHIFAFYEECEPLNILSAGAGSPSAFLMSKIFRHSILLLGLYFPVLAVNFIFNPNLLVFNIIFFIVQVTVLALTVFFKYKIYVPRDMLPGNSMFLVFIQVCTILPFVIGGIPFLLPLPLILNFKYYFSAKKNLKYYLYD